MIDFEIGEDLELVRETAREFAADHLRPALRRHERERAVANEAHAAFSEIGFGVLEHPGASGGDLGALARAVILEELAAADPGAVLALDRVGPALYPLAELGGAAVAESFLSPLLDRPEARAALVWQGEGSGVRLERRAQGVSGVLPWVPSSRVDLLVLLDEDGATLIHSGLHCESVRGSGLRAAGAVEVRLDKAPIAASFVDREGATRALARARLYVAALLVGVMRESAEFSRRYAMERVAFGKPIAHHQGLAFLITDMATSVEVARALVWEACSRLDQGDELVTGDSSEVEEGCATAFVEAAEQALFVTPNGVQILGGHGFMQDHPVEKMMREARALSLLVGGIDLAREHAGRELCSRSGFVPLTVEAGS